MNRMIAQYRFALHKIVKICATEIYDLQHVDTTILAYSTLCAGILTCTHVHMLVESKCNVSILFTAIYAIYIS